MTADLKEEFFEGGSFGRGLAALLAERLCLSGEWSTKFAATPQEAEPQGTEL
jgi:hypothetical protein